MKHKKMLLASISMILVGVIFWLVIGPILFYLGIGSYTTGWWIFTETHYYITTLGYLGIGLTIAGLIVLIIGIGVIVVVGILEVTEQKKTQVEEVKT